MDYSKTKKSLLIEEIKKRKIEGYFSRMNKKQLIDILETDDLLNTRLVMKKKSPKKTSEDDLETLLNTRLVMKRKSPKKTNPKKMSEDDLETEYLLNTELVTKKKLPKNTEYQHYYLKYAVMMMIAEKMYDEALQFLNVSPEINKMIFKHFTRINLKKLVNSMGKNIKNTCFKPLPSEKANELIDDINKISYNRFVEIFQNFGYKIYEGTAYRTTPLTQKELNTLMSEFDDRIVPKIQYLSDRYGGSCGDWDGSGDEWNGAYSLSGSKNPLKEFPTEKAFRISFLEQQGFDTEKYDFYDYS